MTAANLVAYSVQLAALTTIACLAAAIVRLHAPKFALRYWQSILAVAILLPFLQPPQAESSGIAFSSSSAVVPESAHEALAFAIGQRSVAIAAWIVAIGFVVRVAWLLLGMWRVRTLVASATPDESLDEMRDLQTGIGTNASLLITDELEGPATVGVRRPVVLLPRSVLAMSPAVQRAIVCHELVHVRRRDWLHTIGEEVWCGALWFHPAARMIASRISLAREMVVDETTLELTRDRRAYAEALLAFANPQPHVIGVTPFIGRRTLSQRISQSALEDSMSRRRAFVSLALALVASVAVTAATADRFPITTTEAPVDQETVYEAGPGISLPQVVHEVKPGYTRAAMDAKIQGSVWLGVVISQAGDVTNVTVNRSLDDQFGLDAKAVEAAYQWRFKPGLKDGKPVSVRVTVEMTFTLK